MVVSKGKPHYEELLEFPPRAYYGGIVDRALKIPDKDRKPGGECLKTSVSKGFQKHKPFAFAKTGRPFEIWHR